MIAIETVTERSDRLADLMEQRLGVRGRGLEEKLRRAGRVLPRWVRREAERLVAAQRLTAHPKLMIQTDPRGLDTAFHKCEKWLKGVDPAKRRKDRLIGFLGVNAANLLLIVGGFIAWLVWAGQL